jgi:hypothetical protein
MQRWKYAAVSLSLAGFAALAAWGASDAQAQAGPCRLATKGDSPVARACAEGGVLRAKQTMRALLKRAKNAGVRFECEDCHVDSKTDDKGYDRLTRDGREKFAKLLDANRQP